MPLPASAQPRLHVYVLLLGAMVTLNVVLVAGVGGSGSLHTWWSSVGLAVAVLALSTPRRWPLLLALVMATSYASFVFDPDVTMERSTVIALSHGLQALTGALVITRGGRQPARLRVAGDLGYVIAAGLASGAIAAAIEFHDRPGPGDGFRDLALDIFTEHAVSTVLLVSLVLALAQGVRERVALPEFAVQAGVTLAVSLAVFAPVDGGPFTVAPIPFLVWAALRFDVAVAAVELVAFAAIVTISTSQDRGPFATLPDRFDASDIGSITLTYLLAAAVMTLPLSLVVGQRRRLLARISADERLFRRNFTESPLGMVFLHDVDGRLVIDEANAAAGIILEADVDDLVGRPLQDVVAPLDQMYSAFGRLVRGEVDTWHGPAAALGRPGSRLEMAISAIDTAAAPHVYSAQLLDVSQEHDATRRLEAALKLTDATLDTTACVIMVTDSSGTIVRINAATKEITGYGESELVGVPIWDSPLPVLTRSETEAMFVWPNRSGFAIVREHSGHTALGDPVRLVWNNNVVHDDVGMPAYSVLTGIDVTAERSSAGLITHLLQASIATALIGVDAVGRITVVNAGAGQMLGQTPDDMLGRPFVEILDPAQLLARTGAAGEHEAFMCLIGMIGNGEESLARDWIWRTRDGLDLIVSMTLSVTGENVEDRVGFLCVGQDVTAQREAQQTVVEALAKERMAVERLRALDQAKDEFVSTVSHELRTPVTSILGYTEMLRDGSIVDPQPEQVTMLDTIARNSRRLIDICNDLLLLSGFESQAKALSREPVDLRECVSLAEESARALVTNRRLDLHFDAGTGPLRVPGDRDQLDRVFTNLISNAIKFTPDGGTITVHAQRASGGVELSVSDTGTGIAPDDHEAVFQRFFRTESAQVMAVPGTGLGLPIVAGIVEAHGGSIRLESALGEGTTFVVLLPER